MSRGSVVANTIPCLIPTRELRAERCRINLSIFFTVHLIPTRELRVDNTLIVTSANLTHLIPTRELRVFVFIVP